MLLLELRERSREAEPGLLGTGDQRGRNLGRIGGEVGLVLLDETRNLTERGDDPAQSFRLLSSPDQRLQVLACRPIREDDDGAVPRHEPGGLPVLDGRGKSGTCELAALRLEVGLTRSENELEPFSLDAVSTGLLGELGEGLRVGGGLRPSSFGLHGETLVLGDLAAGPLGRGEDPLGRALEFGDSAAAGATDPHRRGPQISAHEL